MNTKWFAGVLLLMCGLGSSPSAAHDESTARLAAERPFSEHAVAETLSRDFASAEISYLLLDTSRDRFVAQNWDDSEKAVPVGSLVKPFTALAYAEAHSFHFPEYVCNGGNACWLPRGHGSVGIVNAISMSCNSYFAELAAQTGAAQVISMARRYGLEGPGLNASSVEMVGQFGKWQESPERLLRAYAILLRRRSHPAIHDLVLGMEASALHGTAAALARRASRRPVLAKTGTAPCTHKHRAPGDGFVIVAWPAEVPRYLLLVRQHGVTGAQSAGLAERMLNSLEPDR